jgi:hypothetical protein
MRDGRALVIAGGQRDSGDGTATAAYFAVNWLAMPVTALDISGILMGYRSRLEFFC